MRLTRSLLWAVVAVFRPRSRAGASATRPPPAPAANDAAAALTSASSLTSGLNQRGSGRFRFVTCVRGRRSTACAIRATARRGMFKAASITSAIAISGTSRSSTGSAR